MQKNEIKAEGLKKVRKIIYGRTLVVAAAFLIQFALLLGGFIFLSDYSFALYGFFLIISASVVIYLYNARGIPDFKLVWMLPIILLPVVGALLYLYFTLQPGTRLIYKRLTDLSEETGKYVIQNPEVKKRLRSTDPQRGQKKAPEYRSSDCPSGRLSVGVCRRSCLRPYLRKILFPGRLSVQRYPV